MGERRIRPPAQGGVAARRPGDPLRALPEGRGDLSRRDAGDPDLSLHARLPAATGGARLECHDSRSPSLSVRVARAAAGGDPGDEAGSSIAALNLDPAAHAEIDRPPDPGNDSGPVPGGDDYVLHDESG